MPEFYTVRDERWASAEDVVIDLLGWRARHSMDNAGPVQLCIVAAGASVLVRGGWPWFWRLAPSITRAHAQRVLKALLLGIKMP